MSGSKTIIADEDRLPNVHPGDVLKHDFLVEDAATVQEVATGAHLDAAVLSGLIEGRRKVDADADLKLARYFGTSEGFFLRLQNLYDLEEANRRIGAELDSIIPRAA